MSFDELKNLAQILQGFSAVFAVIIGGSWAFFKFKALNEITRSKLDLDKKERELMQESVIHLNMTTSSFQHASGSYLQVVVNVKNAGSKVANFSQEDHFPLSLFKVLEGNEGRYFEKIYEDKVRRAEDPNIFANGHIVKAGQELNIPFFIPIKESGLYFVTYCVVIPLDNKEDNGVNKLASNRTRSWVAKSYAIVE